jgi:post-segregation antitoxin (ccd killing protein)
MAIDRIHKHLHNEGKGGIRMQKSTRERINLTVDAELMQQLRQLSADTGIPMSRLIDKAIKIILNSFK